MIQGLVLACSSTPTAIAGSGIHGTLRVVVRNQGTGTLYLGDSAVTTAGFQLTTADGPVTLTVMGGETLFGASSSGATPSVSVLRMNDTT